MSATIKTRLLLQSLLTVAAATMLVVGMVSAVLWRLGTGQAQERLAQAARAMDGAIGECTDELQMAALRITGDKELSGKANFLQENAQKADMALMMGQEAAALAVRVGRAVIAAGAGDGALYAADGGLICACLVEGERLRLVVPEAGKRDALLGVAVEAGKEPQPGDWKQVSAPAAIPLRIAGPQSAEAAGGLVVRAGDWRVEAAAPVRVESLNDKTFQLELVQRGVLRLSRQLGKAFLDAEGGRLGVQLALFLGTTPGAATCQGFQVAAIPPASPGAPRQGLDLTAAEHGSAVVAGDASFTCLVPMRAEGRDGGALALIASQQDMRRSLRWTVALTIVAGVIALAAAQLIAAVMTRAITNPIAGTVAVLNAMAAGDVSRRLPESGPRELAELARAVNATVDGLQRTLDRTAAIAAGVGTDAERLDRTATASAAAVRSIAERSATVSQQAEMVSVNIRSVAAAANQMTASIQDIARNSDAASSVAGEAVGSSREADTAVARLGTSSKDIGSVVQSISAIAAQTNLLALNAAIEAASAGDAGRGFAVVASEVKTLAGQTAEAAADVARRIQSLQSDATAATAAIGRIGSVIGRINELQVAVAAAVEQQSATTGEITRNVTGAAEGAAGIAGGIGEVAQAAGQGAASATETSEAAARLRSLAGELRAVAGGAAEVESGRQESGGAVPGRA